MYQITSGDNTWYVDSLVYIKVNPRNGCYVICAENEADGVCVKVPKALTIEDETITTCVDTVFALVDGGLKGTEATCQIEPAKIALDYFNAKQSEQLLAMIEEVL